MTTRSNNFLSIYAQLNAGTAQNRYASRPDFPLLLDVELTNHCNFSCRMCETGMRTSPRPRGYMQEEIYKKIIEECAAHNTSLRFIRWGEPTLHPHWLKWMLLAKARGLCVHFNTNGSLLTEEIMETLIANSIDSIKFSFQGVDKKSYAEMRAVDFFDTLMQRIARLKSLRASHPVPWIQISTTITDEPPEAIAAFKAKAEAVADYVNVGLTEVEQVDPALLSPTEKAVQKKLIARQGELRRPDACAEVFAKLSVDWDGSVTACCSDNRGEMTVGHLEKQSLADIWNSPQLNNYQRLLSENNFNASPLCKRCYVSMPLQGNGLL